jgi:hypothetical protein
MRCPKLVKQAEPRILADSLLAMSVPYTCSKALPLVSHAAPTRVSSMLCGSAGQEGDPHTCANASPSAHTRAGALQSVINRVITCVIS